MMPSRRPDPFHTTRQVRRFLNAQHGTRLEPFTLDPLTLEIAVRIIRLLFSRRTRKLGRHTLHIVGCEGPTEEGGLVVNQQLKPFYLRRVIPGAKAEGRRLRKEDESVQQARSLSKALRRYQKLFGRCSVLLSANVRLRLGQFHTLDRRIQAWCRIDDGFHITLTGELPWPHTQLSAQNSTVRGRPCPQGAARRICLDGDSRLGAHKGLTSLGLALVAEQCQLHLRTTSPRSGDPLLGMPEPRRPAGVERLQQLAGSDHRAAA